MNVKLTKRKAWELISRIQPRLNIKQEATPSDVAIFKASTGPEGLEIRCENDWFNHNGRIKLTIGNVDGGTPIIRYYYPDTLNRDYVAEQAERKLKPSKPVKNGFGLWVRKWPIDWWISIGEVKPMRIDLNLNPVVGGKVRVMCKSYRQATKKKAKLERAYPDSCYLIGQDTMGYFILRTK